MNRRERGEALALLTRLWEYADKMEKEGAYLKKEIGFIKGNLIKNVGRI